MRTWILAVVVTAVAASAVGAQRAGSACRFSWDDESYFISPFFAGNPRYDGRVTFARIKYQGSYECGREGPGWSHDYPRTESHFVRIMREITTMRPFVENGPVLGSVVLRLDDPQLFKYPVAYLSEPGGWRMTEKELAAFRKYITRGGFIIFDDIEGPPSHDYQNLIDEWRRAFPGAVPIRLSNEHPIFDSFFKIDLSKIPPKIQRGIQPEYMAFFEDNDPRKRMLAIIDNYADVGELIQFSDEGFNPVPANEAYKLWVNYFVYALTH
ncbi:MAG TPA: DUF4159 domain-containing protein [Gemmatimonadaceae bacterium]|nr:DUF4159 domain-containing protein [Gemmatimonadaceae bacterium]